MAPVLRWHKNKKAKKRISLNQNLSARRQTTANPISQFHKIPHLVSGRTAAQAASAVKQKEPSSFLPVNRQMGPLYAPLLMNACSAQRYKRSPRIQPMKATVKDSHPYNDCPSAVCPGKRFVLLPHLLFAIAYYIVCNMSGTFGK